MLRLPKFSTETFGLRKARSMEPLGFMDDICSPSNTRNTSPLPDSLDLFCDELDKRRRKSISPSAATLEQAQIASKVLEDQFGCKAASELKYMMPANRHDSHDETTDEWIDIKFSIGRRRSSSLTSRPATRTRIELGNTFVVDSVKTATSSSKAIERDVEEKKERFKTLMNTGLF